MTRLLASVRNRREAELVFAAGADIIDLKEPDRGALGALDHGTVREIAAFISGRAPVSATIGDLAFEASVVGPAIRAMWNTGVDIVKVGVFGVIDPAALQCIADRSRQGVRIVLVLFAECWQAQIPFRRLADAGVEGIMVDTMNKRDGALPDKLGMDTLCEFVRSARDAGMVAGLAGSLREADVPRLLAADPDYLGFRGALCRDGVRGAELDPQRVRTLRALVKSGSDCNFRWQTSTERGQGQKEIAV